MDRAAIAEAANRQLPDILFRHAASGAAAIRTVAADPAVALVLVADHMLRVGGAGTILAIRDAAPHAGVAVFGLISEREAADWSREGLDGILSRRLEPDRFADALRFLLSGNRYASPEIFDQPATHSGFCAFLGQCGRHFPLLDDMPMALLIVQQGIVAYANRAALAMFDLDEAEMLARKLVELVAEGSRDGLQAVLDTVPGAGPPAPMSLLLPGPGHAPKRIEVQWSRIDLAGAPALCCVCTVSKARTSSGGQGADGSAGGDDAADGLDGLDPALAGSRPISSIQGLDSLTRRQRQVLDLLSEGCTNREIALRLDIAEATVKLHVHHILRALGANNRTEAALLAKRYIAR